MPLRPSPSSFDDYTIRCPECLAVERRITVASGGFLVLYCDAKRPDRGGERCGTHFYAAPGIGEVITSVLTPEEALELVAFVKGYAEPEREEQAASRGEQVLALFRQLRDLLARSAPPPLSLGST